jgi:hypothetical protein
MNISVGAVNAVFPCRLDTLGSFLSDAEAYRLAGEMTRTKQASATILNPSDMIMLPADLGIIPSDLEFKPKTST